MKRLFYPVMLVILSLLSAAFITTVTAKTLASYHDAEKNGMTADRTVMENATAVR